MIAIYGVFEQPNEAQANDLDTRTLIEAAPDGWWYTARLPARRRIVAYLTDADLAPRTLLTREGMLAQLDTTAHIRPCVAEHGYLLRERPRGTSARSGRLRRFAGDGWLAAGDAALALDPLSSQGILTALYSGMRAGQALHRAIGQDREALAQYSDQLTRIYDAYARNRHHYYTAERRWADRPFWRRRS